ncbi:unnamed protein product [Medioppia subpectinata]|uniref:Uncharacterized protein n=1 Tax=Medioppia subpectinata TaxID=1979941 RepID=A0A7R9PXB7_9ACAR|nr:unnamed protein product [Medioppia subpectinata]CAG2104657.1 unnamed protein product [Medioppia subpectinata]
MYGLLMGMWPPVGVDMKYMFHTTQAGISYASPFGSSGYLVGSLAGFLYKYINRQLVLIIGTTIMAIFAAMAPFCTHLWLLYGCHVLAWVGAGVWESSNTVWAIELWADNSAPVLQLSYMLYGLGGILGPLIVRPYLTGDISHTSTTTMGSVFQTTTDISVEDINYSIDRRAKLRTPFMIGGAIGPILLLIMFVVKRYKVPEIVTQEADPDVVDNTVDNIEKKVSDNCLADNPRIISNNKLSKIKILIIILLAMSLSFYTACEVCYSINAVNYFQYIPIHMSAQRATDLTMATTGASTVARLVSTYISSKLGPEIMLTYHLGLGMSAIWSTYFVFGEKYIKLTNKITSVLCFSAAFKL